MSDFEITSDEARHLKEWASDLGLTLGQQKEIHEAFLGMLVNAANRDGYLSGTELALISKAAVTLGVNAPSSSSVDIAIDYLPAGTCVCFTGDARDERGAEIPREVLEARAASAGLVAVSGVTKKSCQLLVAADKSSMSGKTKKARDYGIPVISVEEFLGLI
jgi:DNA polymerase-3 subunit epsilon